MPGIRATRENIDDRFSVLGFTVNTGQQPYFEVVLATQPELIRLDNKGQRTPSNFFASGIQRAERGEAVYLVPVESLSRFVGQPRLYFGLAVMPTADRASAQVVNMPTVGNLYVNIAGLSGRSLRRLASLPSPRRAANGNGHSYGNGNGASVTWAGDAVVQPGMVPMAAPGQPMPAASKQNGATNSASTAPVSNGASAAATALDYDDGFDPHLWAAPLYSNTGTIIPVDIPGDFAGLLRTMLEWQQRGERWSAGVSDTRIFPYSAICRLYATKAGETGEYVGTGFYIGRDAILTAAHMLKDVTQMRIVPGQNGASKPFGEFTVGSDNFSVHPDFDQDLANWHDYDLGVIKVSTPPPNGQYFRVLQELNQSIQNTIIVCGYATESVDGNKQHLDGDTIRLLSDSGGAFLYNLRTEGGTSGSPVFYVNAYEDDVRKQSVQEICIVGVHSDMGNEIMNLGCRLTKDKIAWIKQASGMAASIFDVRTQSLGRNANGNGRNASAYAAQRGPARVAARPLEVVSPIYAPSGPMDALTSMLDFSRRYASWYVGVDDTSFFPHSAICKLVRDDGGEGTGFYIASDRILTAAHVVEGANSLTVIPGLNGADNKPFGSFAVSSANWEVHPQRSNDPAHNFDLAVLMVTTPPPSGAYFDVLEEQLTSVSSPTIVTGYSVASRKYPGVNTHFDPTKQHMDGDTIQRVDDDTFYYNLQTLTGASGSPVYYVEGIEDDVQQVSRMVTRVTGVHAFTESSTLNGACRLTAAKLQWIWSVGRNQSSSAQSLGMRRGAATRSRQLNNGGSYDGYDEAEPGIEGPIPDAANGSFTSTSQAYARPLANTEYPGAARFEAAASSNFRATPAGQTRAINRIVIHITDGGSKIGGPISWFKNPAAKVSAHYIVGQDGEVVQMVQHNDVAWHASRANGDSIGIEHVANTRGLMPTEAEYCASAALVSWLCDQFGIPKDRDHILGHSEADPKTSHTGCPNAVWDWGYYMHLIESGTCEPMPSAAPKAQGLAYARSLADAEYPGARFEAAASGNYRATSAGKTRTINRIVIHTNDGGTKIEGTVSWFKNPDAKVSSHYIVGRGGEVVQMVRHNNVAWHASSANADSIGIEHIANSEKKHALAPTHDEYCASAALVSWLCDQYGIPKDRDHIQGHSEASPRDNHGDPGDIWDWDYYMQLVQSGGCESASPAAPAAPPAASQGLAYRGGKRSVARQLGIEDVPSPFPDTTLTRVSDSHGSVTWSLDQLRGMKAPGPTTAIRAVNAVTVDAPTIRLEGWPCLSVGPEKIYADFAVDWQYDGQSLGNIRIASIGVAEAQGMALSVTSRIETMADLAMNDNRNGNVQGLQSYAALKVMFEYVFTEAASNTQTTAHTELQLFGNGTFNKMSQWA